MTLERTSSGIEVRRLLASGASFTLGHTSSGWHATLALDNIHIGCIRSTPDGAVGKLLGLLECTRALWSAGPDDLRELVELYPISAAWFLREQPAGSYPLIQTTLTNFLT